MNACKVKEEAIGGAVTSRFGKLVEVRRDRGVGRVWVKVGVLVEVLVACSREITVSG
jgi:hypothetical protein